MGKQRTMWGRRPRVLCNSTLDPRLTELRYSTAAAATFLFGHASCRRRAGCQQWKVTVIRVGDSEVHGGGKLGGRGERKRLCGRPEGCAGKPLESQSTSRHYEGDPYWGRDERRLAVVLLLRRSWRTWTGNAAAVERRSGRKDAGPGQGTRTIPTSGSGEETGVTAEPVRR